MLDEQPDRAQLISHNVTVISLFNVDDKKLTNLKQKSD